MLHGKQVVLMPIEAEHLPNYVKWLNDTDVLTYFGPYLPFTIAQEEAWYERQLQDTSSLNFAIAYQDQHIGGCGFGFIDHRNQRAEAGIFIGEKTLWNQGLGQDALSTLVDYGFKQLNFHRIYLRVFPENERGVHAYERVGFQHEGRHRQCEWRHGRWHDLLYMSILRPEWEVRPHD